jgi:hypothetical protein
MELNWMEDLAPQVVIETLVEEQEHHQSTWSNCDFAKWYWDWLMHCITNAPHHDTCIYFYFLSVQETQLNYSPNHRTWCTAAIDLIAANDVPPQLIDLPRHIAEPTDSPQMMQRLLKWWNHRDCRTCRKWRTTAIDWFAANDATARIDLPAAIDWFAAALNWIEYTPTEHCITNALHRTTTPAFIFIFVFVQEPQLNYSPNRRNWSNRRKWCTAAIDE